MHTNSNYAAAQGRKPHRENERGLALVYALLGILLLSMLAAALMLVSSTEAYASFNYKTQTQGSYGSRAGVERAVDWFLQIYGPWLNPGAATSNIAAGTYDLTSDPERRPLFPSAGGAPVILGDSANFPDATKSGEFDGIRTGSITLGNATAGYLVQTAELLSHERYKGVNGLDDKAVERWRITVTGLISGPLANTVVQETAVIRTGKIPLFRDAVRGACRVTVGGSFTTNSYDSNAGAYDTPPGTNINTGKYAGASVASNSFLAGSGSGVISGKGYFGTSASPCPPGESIDDSRLAYPPATAAPGFPYPPIPPFTAGSGKDCQKGSSFALAAPFNSYLDPINPLDPAYSPVYMMDKNAGTPQGDTMGDCSIGSKELLMFRVPTGETPQKFYMRNITSVGQAGLIVVHDTPPLYPPCLAGDAVKCAPVQLYVEDTFNLGGGGMIASTPGIPSRFSVYVAKPSTGCGDSCCPEPPNNDCATYSGNSDFYGTIYAPQCTVILAGTNDTFGAVTGCNVKVTGTGAVHFDLALRDMFVMVTPFRVVNQSRRVF